MGAWQHPAWRTQREIEVAADTFLELENRLADLFRSVLAGDRQAYRRFLAAISPRLRAFIRQRLLATGRAEPSEAEDVLQETLLALHLSLHTYDPGSPVTAWAHAIARHKVIDHLRRTGRHSGHLDVDTVTEAFSETHESATESRLDVARALATLPERTRTLIDRVKLQGHTTAEAAAAAGMSETAVKVAIHRGLRRLARFLRSDFHERGGSGL